MRRAGLILVGAAAAAALTVPASASHRPNHRTIMLKAEPNPTVAGRRVALSGKVTGKNSGNRPVILRRDEFPFDGFSNAANATTDANGDFSFTQRPRRRTRYQVRSGGDESEIVIVGVRIRTGLRLSDRTPPDGTPVRFFGRACPEHDGALVRIQRRTDTKRWRTVRRTRLKDTGGPCSRYSRRVPVGRDGVFRTTVKGDADHRNGISPRRRINVQ